VCVCMYVSYIKSYTHTHTHTGKVPESSGGEDAQDGSFYMSFADFCRYFNRLHVCCTTYGADPGAIIECSIQGKHA
jgi:hypothetical protein